MNSSEMNYEELVALKAKDLSIGDLEKLLKIFDETTDPLIYNQISFLFVDAEFKKASLNLVKKIFNPSTTGLNGSLVYALGELNPVPHFLDFIKILCDFDYECRLISYGYLQEIITSISKDELQRGLELLNAKKMELKLNVDAPIQEDSKEHFLIAASILLGSTLDVT